MLIKTWGYYGTTGTPSLRYELMLNAVDILASNTVDLPTDIGASLYYSEQVLTCRSIGATGSVYGEGSMTFTTATGSVKAISNYSSSATVIDTTIDNTIDIQVQFGTASGSNFLATTNATVIVIF